jgi:protein-tyrosine phosphatase
MPPKQRCVYPAPAKDLIEYKGLLYYPPKKITNHVWIGSEATAADKEFLRKHNIKFVVNCSADIPRFSDIPMLRVPVYDDPSDANKMVKYFGISSVAIRDVTRYGGNVLVHCRAGQNRSSTVVAAYLMTIKKIGYVEAMKLIRARKCETFRPSHFTSSLKQWEKKLVENGVIKPKKNNVNTNNNQKNVKQKSKKKN